MNAIELFVADGRSAHVFFCEKCRVVARDKATADKCCTPNICACGQECRQYWTKCEQCCDAERTAKEAETLAKAEKLDSWDGPVMCDGIGSNDGYFASLDELMEHIYEAAEKQDGDYTPPEFAYVCNSIPFSIDLDDVTYRAQEQMYEGFELEDLEGIEELRAAIEKFNAANIGHVRWEPDYKRAVRLPVIQPVET